VAKNKILITGGAGFIGSNFTRFVLDNGLFENVVVLDNLTYAGNLDNLDGLLDDDRLEFIEGDIADPKKAKEAMGGCRYLVNFAAETHVDRSLSSADPFLHSNIIGVYVLLETARNSTVEKFIHISTDEVYGPLIHGAADEGFPIKPSSPYSASKASADALCHAYRVSFEVPTILVRPANNYGPRQYPEKLIPFFIKRALDGKTLPVYGDGRQQRDWLHVEDNCRAIHLLIEKGEIGETYNVGANNHRLNIDITRSILDILKLPESLIEHVTDRPGHDFRYAIDSSRITKLGWKPSVPFEKGFEETILWFSKKYGGGR